MIENQIKILLIVFLHSIAYGTAQKAHINQGFDMVDILSYYDSSTKEEYTESGKEGTSIPIRPEYESLEKFFQRRYVDEIVTNYNGVHPYFKKNILALVYAMLNLADYIEASGPKNNIAKSYTAKIKEYVDKGLKNPKDTGAYIMKQAAVLMKYFKMMERLYAACKKYGRSIEWCDKNSKAILQGWQKGMEVVPDVIALSGSFANKYFSMEQDMVEAANTDKLEKYINKNSVAIVSIGASVIKFKDIMEANRDLKFKDSKAIKVPQAKSKKKTEKKLKKKGKSQRKKKKYPYNTYDLYGYH